MHSTKQDKLRFIVTNIPLNTSLKGYSRIFDTGPQFWLLQSHFTFLHRSPLSFQNEARLGGCRAMFHSSATTPEASLRPLTTDFKSDRKTVECLTLTALPPLVRITPRNTAVRWHPCRLSDASGTVVLLLNVSVVPAQPSLVLEWQWWPVWKRLIPCETIFSLSDALQNMDGSLFRSECTSSRPTVATTKFHFNTPRCTQASLTQQSIVWNLCVRRIILEIKLWLNFFNL